MRPARKTRDRDGHEGHGRAHAEHDRRSRCTGANARRLSWATRADQPEAPWRVGVAHERLLSGETLDQEAALARAGEHRRRREPRLGQVAWKTHSRFGAPGPRPRPRRGAGAEQVSAVRSRLAVDLHPLEQLAEVPGNAQRMPMTCVSSKRREWDRCRSRWTRDARSGRDRPRRRRVRRWRPRREATTTFPTHSGLLAAMTRPDGSATMARAEQPWPRLCWMRKDEMRPSASSLSTSCISSRLVQDCPVPWRANASRSRASMLRVARSSNRRPRLSSIALLAVARRR